MLDYLVQQDRILVLPDSETITQESNEPHTAPILEEGEDDERSTGVIVCIGEALKLDKNFKYQVGDHIHYTPMGPFKVHLENNVKHLVMGLFDILVGTRPVPVKPAAKKTIKK